MASGHVQGQLLRMLAQLVRPRTVVEIGTYSGYSALCLASGMERGATVYTFELCDEQEDFTRPWLEASPFQARVELFVGDARQLLPLLRLRPELAYIDANKRDYIDYYELLMPMLPPGGLLLADNTLWDGHVLEADHARDAQTQAIDRFNRHVAADPRAEVVILPLRDGLSLIRKRLP